MLRCLGKIICFHAMLNLLGIFFGNCLAILVVVVKLKIYTKERDYCFHVSLVEDSYFAKGV